MHEPRLLDAFKEDPTFFAGAVFLAACGLALLVIALIFLSKKPSVAMGLGFGAALAGLLAMGVGFAGSAGQKSRTRGAVSAPGLSSSDRERIIAFSNVEARYVLYFGLGVGLIPLLGGAGLGAMGASRSKKSKGV